MSFTDLKIADLRKVAETFAVDLGTEKSKAVIIAQLEEEGITYQMYDKFLGAEKEEIEVPALEKKKREKTLKQEDTLLVKMERNNHSYQTMGYTFSTEHPFVAMATSDAQKIFDMETGFRVATPREAQEYYA
jgi:parvulin-like peptidyl-prolyl isomerase